MIREAIQAAFLGSGYSEISSNWIPENFSGYGKTTPAGVYVSESSALTSSAVFACIRCISETIGSLPRHIVDKSVDGKRINVSDHPSLDILTREANPFTTSMSFFETVQAHAMSYGNGYAELEMEKNGGRVIRAWILPPNRVSPKLVELENGSLDLRYIVTLPDGTQGILPRERVLHIPGIGFDGITGYPVVEYAAKAIGLGQAIEGFSSTYFSQGENLTGYVSVPAGMEPEAIKNLRRTMIEYNSGLENRHRDKFLLEGVQFTPASKSPDDSQLLESRTFQIQDVARFFRIPLHKIQEYSKASYNSMEQLQDEFRTDTIVPWSVRWEQELNRKFFIDPKDKNYRIKFNTNALMRGDSTARSAFYRTMVSFGLMTINEIRALEDLSSMEGGDELLVPLNMTKLNELLLNNGNSEGGNE